MTRNKLLLAIDTQIDFIAQHAALPVPGADQIVGPGITFLQNLDRDQYAAALFTYDRSEEHTSELQSLMRISYAVFCLKNKKHTNTQACATITDHTSRTRYYKNIDKYNELTDTQP